MAYTLEKQYFKKYLHKNCHRWWFSKSSANAQYEDKNGTHNIDVYADEYTLRIRDTLEDSYLNEDNRALRYSEVGNKVAGPLAGAGALWAASLCLGPFAPVGAAIATAGGVLGSATYGVGEIAGKMKNRPKDVYFHIVGDDSYWKIEKVPCDEIREWAYKICRWSNEVYRERYIQRRSDNYEFQAQIEQRPPTPY